MFSSCIYTKPSFSLFDRSQLCLVVDVTYHVPCLESHFKGFHLAIARLSGLLGRLLRVEVKKNDSWKPERENTLT